MSKKNEWTKVSFADILDYVKREEISKISFARKLGITNSTFHNWKNQKSVPDEPMQEKIAAMIGSTKGKGKAKAADLDSLKRTAASPRAATAAKKAGRVSVAKAPARKMSERKTGPRPAVAAALRESARKAPSNGHGKNGNGHSNGNGSAYPTERAFLVSSYMQHHGVESIEEYKQLIEEVTSVTS